MAFAVVYDACVLYPSVTRDLLIRVGIEGLVRAHWSERILDEVFRNLKANRPDLDPANLDRTRSLMAQALPDAWVTGHEPLIQALTLPDPDDRHVLAAAIRTGAQVIVTDNIRDFPSAPLAPFGIEARTADDFLADQIHISAETMRAIVRDVAASWTDRPNGNVVLDRMESAGLLQAAALLRRCAGT